MILCNLLKGVGGGAAGAIFFPFLKSMTPNAKGNIFCFSINDSLNF